MKNKILVYGDIHLHSKNYGAHIDYAKESLYYFRNITDTAEELGITHIIGCGDLTYARFHSLEYRLEVEKELEKQMKITNGNRFEVKGNHDEATYGLTEYEYYIKKGLLRKSTNLEFDKLNISMVDFNKHDTHDVIISKDKLNIVICHEFIRFTNTKLPNYGTYLNLDEFTKWAGVDYIIAGHVHGQHIFSGNILGKETIVIYPGCPTRTIYRAGHMSDIGQFILIESDDKETKAEVYEYDLLPLEECFNIEVLENEKTFGIRENIDIEDVISKLNNYNKTVGNIEDIIMAMTEIDLRYRNKAVELIRAGL